MKLYILQYFFALFLFFCFHSGISQNVEHPWKFNLDVNVIDTYPTGDSSPYLGNSGGVFQDFLNAGNNWNIGGPSVSISRHFFAGLSLGLQGGLNKIQKINGVSDPDISYYSVDAFLSFNLINSGNFHPFFKVGYGLSSFNVSNDLLQGRLLSINTSKTILGGIGFDIMFNQAFGVTLQSEYRSAFEIYGTNHFQHRIGISYHFGSGDIDKDGVPDKKDECPQIPGLKEYNGCPDTDGDTVIDKNDICPEIFGQVALNGCPDTDGDGVSDPEDVCVDIYGTAELNGCPDTDGDGIADDTDACIQEVGPLENNGCPWSDIDNDGVFDKDDLCKDEPGPELNNGCPELSNEIIKTINEFGAKINFAANSDKILGKKMRTILFKIRDILQKNPIGNLLIEGYASADGDDKYNTDLSFKRADAVRSLLIKLGVKEKRLEVEGLGETSPIGNNELQEGRAENRRVQFTYKN